MRATSFSSFAWSLSRFLAAAVEQVHYVNEEYEEALKNYTMAVTLEAVMLQVSVLQSPDFLSRHSEVSEFLASIRTVWSTERAVLPATSSLEGSRLDSAAVCHHPRS